MENNSLHVLTDEQLAKLSQEGQDAAEELLIERYKSVVKTKAKAYYIVGADHEDVVQEGMIGLFKAIRYYDVTKEATFKTFADTCVSSQIISAIKKANRRKHQPLNESISFSGIVNEGDKTTTLEDVLVGSEEHNPEVMTVFREVVDCLKEQDSGIFSKLEWAVWNEKLKGYPYTEIAEHLGKSPKSIDNTLQRIKKKILAYLQKE